MSNLTARRVARRFQPAERYIAISMACNDPDNGLFAGRVCQISLPDDMLDLTAKAWNITSYRGCPKLVDVSRRDQLAIRLAGKTWPIHRQKDWVGNWCWNSYSLSIAGVSDFLVWLHGRRLFQCEGGWTKVCDAWEQPALDRAVMHSALLEISAVQL